MTLRRKTLAAATASMALLTTAPASAERPAQIDNTRSDTVTLTHSFARGQSSLYELIATQTIEQLEGDGDLTASLDITLPVRVEVQSVDDGGLATVTTSMGDPTIAMIVDEDDEDPDDAEDILDAARITQVVQPDGTVVETSGALEEDGSVVNATGMVSDLLSALWIQFPTDPVAIGDTWLQTMPLAMGGDSDNLRAVVNARYTLAGYAAGVGGEQVVIDVEYTQVIEGDVQQAGVPVYVVGRGLSRGYILFDHRGGVVTESGVEGGLVLTFNEPNGDRMTMSLESSATVAKR